MASLTLLGSVIDSTLAQFEAPKRITAVQVGKLDNGSRVSVFSDSDLNDYEAFRRGDRFYVRFPRAAFGAARPSFSGAGFQDIQVQEVNGGVLLSFKLQPGANARVDQHPNRLDVIFSFPGQVPVNVARTPSNRNNPESIPGVVVQQNGRPRIRNTADAAGPMPPDTPIKNRPRVVTPGSSEGIEVVQSASRSHVQSSPSQLPRTATGVSPTTVRPTAPDPNLTANKSVNDPWKPANKNEGVSTATTQPTQTTTPNQPSSSWQPSSRQPSPVSTTTTAGWKRQRDVATRWIAANKVASLIAGLMLLGLLTFGGALAYRRRRRTVRATRQRVPGVKPKSSPNDEAGESFEPQNDESATDGYDAYEPTFVRSKSALGVSPVELEKHGEEVFHWVEGADVTSNRNEPWVHQTSTIPNYAMNNEAPEREVFEI